MTGRRDTSADDMSYACRLANRGFSIDQIARALAAKPSGRREPGSVKYWHIFETKGKDQADAYAGRTAEKAVAFVAHNPAIRDGQAALLRIREIAAAADALPWTVYASPGVRRSLEAAFTVAERCFDVNIGLAIREHALLAGQDFEQTRAHRKMLEDLGWLRRNPSDRPGRTSRYTLRTPSHIQLTPGRLECGDPEGRALLPHDAWRPRALGDVSWYVTALLAVPSSASMLAIRTGLSDEMLEDVLLTLESNGVVLRTDDCVARSPDLEGVLDDIAARFGTRGDLVGDRQRFKDDRDRYRFRPRQDVNVGADLIGGRSR